MATSAASSICLGPDDEAVVARRGKSEAADVRQEARVSAAVVVRHAISVAAKELLRRKAAASLRRECQTRCHEAQAAAKRQSEAAQARQEAQVLSTAVVRQAISVAAKEFLRRKAAASLRRESKAMCHQVQAAEPSHNPRAIATVVV